MTIEKGSVAYMRLLTKKLHEKKLITTCITCEHWNSELELCKLVMRRPPADVIAYGCDSWQDVDLPF